MSKLLRIIFLAYNSTKGDMFVLANNDCYHQMI